MKAPICRLRQIVEILQEIIDEADSRGITEVRTECNTYGLNEFISLGSDGFLNTDKCVDELLDEPEFDDDKD